jgi:hypothetical protein
MIKAVFVLIIILALFLVDFSAIDSSQIGEQIGHFGNFIISKFS